MVLSWFVINFLEKSLQLVHINMAQEVTESQIYHTSQKPFFVPRKKKDHFSSHSFWRDRVCSVIEARSSGARGGKSMLSALRRRPGRIV